MNIVSQFHSDLIFAVEKDIRQALRMGGPYFYVVVLRRPEICPKCKFQFGNFQVKFGRSLRPEDRAYYAGGLWNDLLSSPEFLIRVRGPKYGRYSLENLFGKVRFGRESVGRETLNYTPEIAETIHKMKLWSLEIN